MSRGRGLSWKSEADRDGAEGGLGAWCAMALRALIPEFETRELRHGKGWIVHASWSNGRTADIPNFASRAEADQWIKTSSTAWLEERSTGSHDRGAG